MKSQMRTDVGRIRKKNEDAVFIGNELYILCDGMGGHQAGDVASNLAVEMIAAALQKEAEPSVRALLQAITQANEFICQRSQAEQALRGMGTTLTILWAAGDQALIGQIGDSRAYLLRGGLLRQCTHDHSLVAELVRMGRLTPEEARTHPNKNLVTRALGTEARVDADIFEMNRQPGDRWLLCSDGLTDQVSDGEIAAILGELSLDDAADRLLHIALERGGPDNITLLVVDDERGGID